MARHLNEDRELLEFRVDMARRAKAQMTKAERATKQAMIFAWIGIILGLLGLVWSLYDGLTTPTQKGGPDSIPRDGTTVQIQWERK